MFDRLVESYAKKKECLKQAILGCPDLISLEMFENLHLQKHGRTLDYKKHREMVFNMCGSLDASREASKSGHTKRLSHLTETSEHEANIEPQLLHQMGPDPVPNEQSD